MLAGRWSRSLSAAPPAGGGAFFPSVGVMPKNFEFVIAAYGIWVVSFSVYFYLLMRRSRRLRAALERMAQARRRDRSGA